MSLHVLVWTLRPDSVMTQEPATGVWSSTRKRILRRFHAKVPRHKREPLDIAEIIHLRFPEWSWLEIAGWMDGSIIPTEIQQVTLLQWERTYDAP